MNPSSPSPSDDELDRLLASKLKRTSPEFEQRWRELRTSFVRGGHAPRFPSLRWLVWPGLATATIGILAVMIVLRQSPPPPATANLAALEELFALDAALVPASALLDAENRDAVLHLSSQTKL